MATKQPTSEVIWLVIFILGFGTYAFRLSFIQLLEWIGGLPPQVEAALSYIPPAILAALIFPELFLLQKSVVGIVLNARVVAGSLAFVVAWRTESMIATIGVGMVTLWIAQFFGG